tara:strand:+ start:2834 stop:3637 length:804 start_codon:yes stop_codon:yes gene_type:complete
MNSNTRKLKKKISSYGSCEERIDILKDKYLNKTAVILLPGPSLGDFDHEDMRKLFSERDDLVILPCKKTYEVSLSTTDFHIMNPWNIDRKTPTKYIDNDTIVFWNVTAAYQDEHLKIIEDNNHSCDIWIPCLTVPYITPEQAIHRTCDFEKFKMLGNEYRTLWGTPILYSTAIPLGLHLGCNNFIIFGWDTHNFNKHKSGEMHLYHNTNTGLSFTGNKDGKQEEMEVIESSYKLYDWCQESNINMKIASDVSPIDERFERITKLEDI